MESNVIKMSSDFVLKTGFFTKTKYYFENGSIKKSVYSLFGLWHRKDRDEEFSISEIGYIEQVHLLSSLVGLMFGRTHAVELVSEHDNFYIPRIKEKDAQNLVNEALSLGAKHMSHEYLFEPSSRRAMSKSENGIARLMDHYGKMVKKVYKADAVQEDVIALDSVIYFDEIKVNGVDGIAFGNVAGGGASRTIEFFGLKKEENQEIYKMLVANNPKLADTGVQMYKSIFPLFTPNRWFKGRETIILTDWGLLHTQRNVVIDKKKFKTRTSVLNFDTIKSYTHTGFFVKKMTILGATTISTEENYSLKARRNIWKKFVEAGINNKKGKTYKASLFHRRGQGKITLTDEHIMWKHKKEIHVLAYNNVYYCEFSTPHWYSFYGDIHISSRRIDARSGEGGDVVMEITHICKCKGKRLVREIEARKDN